MDDEEIYTCCECDRTMPYERFDKDIRRFDNVWVCEDCAPDYIEEVLFDTASAERFYV